VPNPPVNRAIAPRESRGRYFSVMTGISYRTTAEDVASRALEVTVPIEQLEATEQRAVREYARKTRLPGFRKGHAPEPVVRRRFETEIRRFVLEDALRQGWEAILKDSALKPTADPQIRNVAFEQGKPLTFEVLVEIRPELTLATTGGFTLTRTVPVVTDDMVREQLQQLREQRGTWTPVGADVRPKPGNLVSVTVTPIEEGGEPVPGQPHDIVLGQGHAIPDLEERIMGMAPGETTDAEVRFPDDHSDEARRGQSRNVRLTLHEVKEQVLPPLDDALARELGDFDSLAALESRVREDLASEVGRRADDEVKAELVRQLAEANEVPAPPSMVNRLLHAYADSYRVTPERLETFATSFRPVAEMQVRRELVLDAVATARNLRATEADIDERVAAMAASRGMDAGKLYASLQQNGRIGEIEHAITEDKVFGWLMQQSTITEGAA
jgi:trigger factor